MNFLEYVDGLEYDETFQPVSFEYHQRIAQIIGSFDTSLSVSTKEEFILPDSKFIELLL